jgi:hypothetical protein
MADRKRIIRKVDEDEDDEVTLEAEDVEDSADEDTEPEDDADTPPAPVKKVAAPAARKVVVPPPAAKTGKSVAKPVTAPAKTIAKPGAKPAAKPVAPAKPGAKPAPVVKKPVVHAPVEEPEEDAAPATLTKVKKVEDSQMEILASTLLNTLNNRQTLVITKLDDGKFSISLADAKVMATTSGKLRGKEYWDEVLHPDYVAWQTEWKAMTQAEKAALCKKAKVTWEHQEDPRVDAIKMADAYCRAMGISKYKDEYKERKVREAISA